MNRVEALCRQYKRHVSHPWERNLSGAEKVLMAVYPPEEELRLRYRMAEFEIATQEAGHDWALVDFTHAFAEWIWEHDYRDAYFEEPELLTPALQDFETHCTAHLRETLTSNPITDETVVAVVGAASLFSFMRVSKLVREVQDDVRGRLLVFFPGEHSAEKNVYRLLDARDGWNYMAVAITPSEGMGL